MPAGVQTPCKHPSIDPIDARVIIARYIGALKVCEGKRADAVAFYDDLRAGLR